MYDSKDYSNLPDVRDGLTHKERIILYCLKITQEEFKGHNVPTITLYGRVCEHINISQGEFLRLLAKMTRVDE